MLVAKPLISVLITSYNYRHYITGAIDSALAQTYPNFEVIVSDNCSSDGTVPMLRDRYGDDPRVKIFENAENVGMIVNGNLAFERSTGALVLWLSADDLLLPRHLERLAAMFERQPALDVVYSGSYFSDEGGRVFGIRSLSGQFPVDYIDARDELVEMLTTTCPLCWPTALFRRNVFDDVGLSLVGGPLAGDWELQVRVALAGKRFAYLADPSTVVRIHAAQATGDAYHRTGANVVDFVAILELYIDHPGMIRMRGREAMIANFIGMLAENAVRLAGSSPFSPEDEGRIADIRRRLLNRAERYEPARVREWKTSVIVAAMGPPQSVLRALDSVAAQTIGAWEIVVVDQGPIPLENVLCAHPAWERMSYLRLPSMLRSPGAIRNFGIRMARGELLAFLDEGDSFAPGHLESLVATIERSGSEIAVASSRLLMERHTPQLSLFETVANADVFRSGHDSDDIGSIAAALPLSALLQYRRAVEQAGRFNETLPVLDEFEYLMRLERAAPFAFSGQTTLDVHVRFGLAGQALGARLPNYLAVLDSVYRAYPNASLDERRARHRCAVERAIANVNSVGSSPQLLAEFVATLAGRAVVPMAAAR
ncbi:MAG TPA: glycosyltransferase [Candidatus Lustribacter sp.]